MDLRGHGRDALLAGGSDFRGKRLASDASGAVVAGAAIRDVDGGVVDDDRVSYGAVIDLNIGDGYIVDGTVVVETISVPVAALIAGAHVAESIVNAAVVANVPSPITVVVTVAAASRSPIARSPQITHLGWTRPRAGDPVIAL